MAYTDADDAAALAADMGLDLFPWQRDVLADWMARDRRDRASFSTVGLSAPRQNGKNALLEAFELYHLAVCGSHILHTAHRVKTAKKSFQRLERYFTDRRHPEVRALVRNIRYTNGEEAIYLENGGSVEFSARSRAGSRGFDDIQAVVFDEAQDLTDDQLSAIMYTLAASSTGDRQLLFTGTPPDAASPGTVFKRNRDAALAGETPRRTLWTEWGEQSPPPRTKPPFREVLDAVYAANPSMGYTLDEEFTETEYANADALGFWTERLGWWPERSSEAAVPKEKWEACAVGRDGAPAPAEGDVCAFGVKFSPDGSCMAMAAAVRPKKGRPHVELLAVMGPYEGAAYAQRRCEESRERVAEVAVDGLNGGASLSEALSRALPRRAVPPVSSSDVAKAADMLLAAVEAGEVTHLEDEDLDRSALTSGRRPIGSRGGWGFGGEFSAPIEACALAYRAAMTTSRRPGRKARIIG